MVSADGGFRDWQVAAAGLAVSALVLAGLGWGVGLPIWAIAGTAALYLASHILRAFRLAILATPVLGISGRSAGLLHLVVAPASLLLPFKLGEVLRLQQLHWLAGGGDWLRPLVVLILDRMMDAVLIAALFVAFSVWHGGAAMPTLVVLSLGTLAFAVAVFGVLPSTLTTLQRYVVINHQAAMARRWLAVIDRLRSAITIGADQIRIQGAAAFLVSAAIWTAELAAMGVLLLGAAGLPEARRPSYGPVELLLNRAAIEWRIFLGAHDDALIQIAAVIGLVALLAVWPLALWLYLRRRRLEPLRLKSFAPVKRSPHGI